MTISINYPNAGTISPAGTTTVPNGDPFTCSVTSKVAGYSFSGWYSGNSLMSTLQSYTFTPKNNISLEARYSIIHDASFSVTPTTANAPANVTTTSTYNVEITQRTWVVQDKITGEKLKNTTTNGTSNNSFNLNITKGRALSITQTVTYTDGQQATSSVVKIVDEVVNKHFAWKYQKLEWYSLISYLFSINNGSSTWDVPMNFSWYYNALSSSLPRTGSSDTSTSVVSSYVTYNDSKIKSMAQGILSYTSGWSDTDRVNYVLKFVQSIPYQYDRLGKGAEDYWKLPAETLWEGKGDCEDHAFLFASLVKAMGYKVIVHFIYCYEGGVLVAGHIATSVAVPGANGYYTSINGVKYYYCEATAEVGTKIRNDSNVGEKPAGYVIVQTWMI